MLTIIKENDTDVILQKAAQFISQKLRDALAVQSSVTMAVPGGRSVAKIFDAMRQELVDWTREHFFIIDERLVPIDHPDSNYRLLKDHLITPLAREGKIPPDNAHPFILDTTASDLGTRAYEEVLAKQGFRYDIILLSSGEDGHVGALFPDHHSVTDPHHGFIVMDDSPKPPPERMTSSLSLMLTAQTGILLFTGESKREAFGRFCNASISVSSCPARLLVGMKDATVFTDQREE
jgi:6-phosphogluconolactonase